MRALSKFRQPEYTGENRCLPCTAVNAAIALVLSAAVVGVGAVTVGWSYGAVASGAVLAFSAAAIWLRGYLVPGTPALTKRYMPPWMLAWFGKGPAAAGGPGGVTVAGGADGASESGDGRDGDHLERVLREADVLEPCEDDDDLCLTVGFKQDLREAFEAVPDEPEVSELVAALGIDAGDVTVDEHDDAVVLRRDGMPIGKWPSATAIQVEVAAARVLEGRFRDWAETGPRERSELLGAVRLFLEECPDGSAVEASAETVESCCSTHEVVTLDCGTDRILEQRVR